MTYNDAYYNLQKAGSLASARVIVPIVFEYFNPTSVVDVGCGVGTWLSVFAEHGVRDILGFDGKWINLELLYIPKEKFISCNLEAGIKADRVFDLAVCLEVAEHLPSSSSKYLIDSLTKLAPVVLFSAAIPGQDGKQANKLHLNEQMIIYWVNLFSQKSYVPVDPIRKRIWTNHYVEPWYAQNILFFVKETELKKHPKLLEGYTDTCLEQLSIVHPAIYNVRPDPENMQFSQLLYALFENIKSSIKRILS
jgi:hypothetical protein